MLFGVPGLKKALTSIAVLIAASVVMVSCGSSSRKQTVSGLKFRAFVSNPLLPSAGGNSPVVNIVDASRDTLSTSFVNLLGFSNQPGLMAVSSNLKFTMVFSPSGNTVTVLDNTTEAIATVSGGTSSVPVIGLPGSTESMLIGNDNVTGFAAVPSASINGQAPGAVVAMNLGSGSVTATIPVAGAHFLVLSHDGNHILVFSDNSNSVTVIATALIGSNENPITATVPGFDHPAGGIFSSDDTIAYIFDCGPECQGTAAGITPLDMATSSAGTTVPLSAATTGLLSGGTLYVAGTPRNTPCGSGTAAKNCGTLNLVNVASMTVINASPIVITDGYHDRMQISQNGQLFIGAHSCSNVNVPGGEVRGCLSIFNTSNSSVVVPPQIGDVTGIQPISGRNIVYVCQNGVFQIFDTTTDKLLVQQTPTNIVGQSTDVKLVDPPPS